MAQTVKKYGRIDSRYPPKGRFSVSLTRRCTKLN